MTVCTAGFSIRLFVNQFNYETHSVNNGIRHARGAYVALLHSDDEFWPTKLEKQVRYWMIIPRSPRFSRGHASSINKGRTFPTRTAGPPRSSISRSIAPRMAEVFLYRRQLCVPSLGAHSSQRL